MLWCKKKRREHMRTIKIISIIYFMLMISWGFGFAEDLEENTQAGGFSEKMATPLEAAATMGSARTDGGVQMKTASISSLSNISSKSV